MYEIRETDLPRKVLAKYSYRTYWNAFTFYVLAYKENHWEILRSVSTQSNHTQYGASLRITTGNLDWVTRAERDESFKPCSIEELLTKI